MVSVLAVKEQSQLAIASHFTSSTEVLGLISFATDKPEVGVGIAHSSSTAAHEY